MHKTRKIHAWHGFTLVELLAVLAILSILVGLAVSVGKTVLDQAKRQQTRAIQSTVIEALQSYYRVKDVYPDNLSALMKTESQGGVEGARDKLLGLPDGVVDFDSDSVRDAYGNEMTYYNNGAMGGGPLLVSGGPDGNVNTPEDNIYSDER